MSSPADPVDVPDVASAGAPFDEADADAADCWVPHPASALASTVANRTIAIYLLLANMIPPFLELNHR